MRSIFNSLRKYSHKNKYVNNSIDYYKYFVLMTVVFLIIIISLTNLIVTASNVPTTSSSNQIIIVDYDLEEKKEIFEPLSKQYDIEFTFINASVLSNDHTNNLTLQMHDVNLDMVYSDRINRYELTYIFISSNGIEEKRVQEVSMTYDEVKQVIEELKW
ncbi:MAG: hypothetical protein IJE45_00340 [Bacilli bacterium]|nr:hypothetical protein [Bacilli bacterium]